jgi:DNA polymerase III subunit epsilon
MLKLLKNMLHKADVIDPTMPLTDTRFVVVDTELTGLDEKRDSIVSIGAVRMIGGAVDIGNTFYRLINPDTALSASSIVIHEITPSEVATKPPIDIVLNEFVEFCGDSVLMGHFLSLDLAFLNREMKRITGHGFRNAVLDTYSMYEWLARRIGNHGCFKTPTAGMSLYDIVQCFGIPIDGVHNAVLDAYMTAQLFQRFLPLLSESGIKSIGGLLPIGKPFKGGDRAGLHGEFSNF